MASVRTGIVTQQRTCCANFPLHSCLIFQWKWVMVLQNVTVSWCSPGTPLHHQMSQMTTSTCLSVKGVVQNFFRQGLLSCFCYTAFLYRGIIIKLQFISCDQPVKETFRVLAALKNHICKQLTTLLHPYLPCGNRSQGKCAQFFFFHVLLYYCIECCTTQTATHCNSLTICQFSIIILQTCYTFDCMWDVASQPGTTPLLTLSFLLLKGLHPLENSAAVMYCFTVYCPYLLVEVSSWHTIHEQEQCSLSSSMIISFHDTALLQWLNWESTVLHTHMWRPLLPLCVWMFY
jgi:hypothetical protein